MRTHIDEQVGLNAGGLISGLGTASSLRPALRASLESPTRTVPDRLELQRGRTTSAVQPADINGDLVAVLGVFPGSVFTGFDDWAHIKFRGGAIGALGIRGPCRCRYRPPRRWRPTNWARIGLRRSGRRRRRISLRRRRTSASRLKWQKTKSADDGKGNDKVTISTSTACATATSSTSATSSRRTSTDYAMRRPHPHASMRLPSVDKLAVSRARQLRC